MPTLPCQCLSTQKHHGRLTIDVSVNRLGLGGGLEALSHVTTAGRVDSIRERSASHEMYGAVTNEVSKILNMTCRATLLVYGVCIRRTRWARRPTMATPRSRERWRQEVAVSNAIIALRRDHVPACFFFFPVPLLPDHHFCASQHFHRPTFVGENPSVGCL